MGRDKVGQKDGTRKALLFITSHATLAAQVRRFGAHRIPSQRERVESHDHIRHLTVMAGQRRGERSRDGKRHTRGREAGNPPHLGRELEGREMRKPFLSLSTKRGNSGKPSALKGARSVWERGVGNVRMTTVRERRVPAVVALASPFGDEATR